MRSRREAREAQEKRFILGIKPALCVGEAVERIDVKSTALRALNCVVIEELASIASVIKKSKVTVNAEFGSPAKVAPRFDEPADRAPPD